LEDDAADHQLLEDREKPEQLVLDLNVGHKTTHSTNHAKIPEAFAIHQAHIL
jgi:hypothetical protein